MKKALQPPDRQVVTEDIARALAEDMGGDMGGGDCTANLIPAENRLETRVISRENAILCGQPWFEETFFQLEPEIEIIWQADDGDRIHPEQEVCRLSGPARAILSGERTALNFLQTLSGTATRTSKYVEAVRGTDSVILDTRKTIPGMRLAQKYAVRCGGAHNHRIGLFDAILIKENHISAAGSIAAAVEQANHLYPDLLLEVEVENLEQLEEAQRAGAQRALLDNFDLYTLGVVVDRFKGRIELEASGGIELDTIGSVAKTGVDFISTGDVTKNLRATDFSMRFV